MFTRFKGNPRASRFTRRRSIGALSHRDLRLQYHGRGPRRGWLRRIALALCGAAVLGGLAFLANATAELVSESQFFAVKGVKVRGASYLAEETILAQIGEVRGASLIDVHPEEIAERLEMHPRIRRAKVSRGFDRRIQVVLEEREPIALVETGVLVEVDVEGFILPPIERAGWPDLPVLTGAAGRVPTPGTQLKSPAVRDALDFLADLSHVDAEFLDMISEMDLRQSPICSIHLVGRPQVIKVNIGSISAAKLAGLRLVLKDLEARGRTNVEVDLRFEGQLVVRDLT